MKLIKRIIAGICALSILVISFPVTVKAATEKPTSISDWVGVLSGHALSKDYLYGSYALEYPSGYKNLVLVTYSDSGTRTEIGELKSTESLGVGFYRGLANEPSKPWSDIKKMPGLLLAMAKAVKNGSSSQLTDLDTKTLFADQSIAEGVSTQVAFRDYFLRAYVSYFGSVTKTTDVNKLTASAQVIHSMFDDDNTPLTSVFTSNNSQFASCTTVSSIANVFATQAAKVQGKEQSSGQEAPVTVDVDNAYSVALKMVYEIFSNTRDDSVSVSDAYKTIFGIENADTFKFQGRRSSDYEKYTNSIVMDDLGNLSKDRALLAARILVACSASDSVSGPISGFTVSERFEVISAACVWGTNTTLKKNSNIWNLANGLVSPETSVENRVDRYKSAWDELNARVALLKKSSPTDVEKLRKTLGLRIQISWALSGVRYSSSQVDTAAAKSSSSENKDGFEYSNPTQPVEGAFMPPHPDTIGSSSYTLTDAKTSPFFFDNYMELKNEMSEVYALSQVLHSSLDISRLQTSEPTSDDRIMFKYLDDIRDAISAITTNTSWEGSLMLKKEFQTLWSGKPPATFAQSDKSLEDIYNALEGKISLPENEDFIVASDSQPLKNFFNLETSQVSDNIQTGIELSATYIPFKTNVYNVETYRPISDNDEFTKFHSRWGYNRKALYIDTNVNAVTEYYNTRGNIGNKRLCTLKDLLEPEREIQLYVDDNFYNAGELQAYQEAELGRLDYTDTSESTKNILERFWDRVGNFFKFNILDVLKTAEKDQYASQLSDVDTYGASKKEGWKPSSEKEIAVLSGSDIDNYTGDKVTDGNSSYNVMESMAFTSAVYRYPKLFNLCKSTGVKPVFQSSKNVAYISGASSELKYSIFNYALLKNIQHSQSINFTSNLDRDRAVYMDVYGNIVTESGYVVIPAAANATLYHTYNAKTAAFLTTYGSAYYIPSDLDWISNSSAGSMFETNSDKKAWTLVAKAIGEVDYNRLDTSSDSTKEDLMTLQEEFLKAKQLVFDNYIRNIFLEVMRGAPLEKIDKVKEGLNPNAKLSKAGIVQAAKLDSLKSSLNSSSQNAILAIPNLAYVDGLEYIVLFIYKISIIICIFMLLSQIFWKAMQGRFGIQAILSMFLTIALTLGAMLLIPKVFDISYYASNRALLQGEAETISMLNLEKQESGMEIGMTEVKAPDVSTSLLLKMKDVDIPWYDAFFKVVSSPISSSLGDIYKSYADTDPAMHEEQFEFRAGSLYVPVDKLYSSSTVLLDPRINALSLSTQANVPASFYTPYYVFLQTLITSVNQYNVDQNVYTYTTATYSGGKKKSLGLIQNYFTSDEFIDPEQSSDLLKLNVLYQTANGLNVSTVFSSSEIKSIQKSLWYNGGVTGAALNSRIDKLDASTRKFVADNKSLIGKVSDETFLKVMALHLAIEYNKLFSIGTADALELYNLSQDDLTRISIAPRQDVIEGSALSFSRFVYIYGGEPAVYAAGLLSVVNFISDWIKPIATLFILLAVFVSLFIYKILLGNKSDSARGYILLVLALSATNLAYSVLLKAALYLPNLGLPPTVCMLFQILLQFVLIAMFAYLSSIVVINWRDLGSAKFTSLGYEIKHDFAKSKIVSLLQDNAKKSEDSDSKGWRIYKAMKEADKVRKYKAVDRKERR